MSNGNGLWRLGLLMGLGSALGGGARLLLQEAAHTVGAGAAGALFIATVVANVLAGAALGWVHGRERTAPANAFLGTGFCGGFSTFSLFTLDGLFLLFMAQPALAMLYWIASLGLALWLYHAVRVAPLKGAVK